jgi:hypothetical protein
MRTARRRQRAATLTKLKYFKVSVQTELRRDDHEIAAPSAHEATVRALESISDVLAGGVFLDQAVLTLVVTAMPKAELLNHQGALA